MRTAFAHRWLNRPWFAALLLAAFMARALIPVGFMPGPGGLILCSGYAAMPGAGAGPAHAHDMAGMDMAGMDMGDMPMDPHAAHAGHPDHASPHDSTGVCAYAAFVGAAAASDGATTTVLLHAVSLSVPAPADLRLPRGTIVPTRLPRGPPSVLV